MSTNTGFTVDLCSLNYAGHQWTCRYVFMAISSSLTRVCWIDIIWAQLLINSNTFTCMKAYAKCHAITLTSPCDGWLQEWTSVAQLLRSRTAPICSVPVSPVHIKVLSILDIHDLPRLRFPSTRPVIKLKSKTCFGDRAFSVAGPRCWNNITTSVRSTSTLESFKSRLKPHYFKKSYLWHAIGFFQSW